MRISPAERDLRLDHFILSSLQESLLSGDLGLIDVRSRFDALDEADSNLFRRRLFYLIGQECLGLFPIGSTGEITITEQTHLREHPESIPLVRITSVGFVRLAEIERELVKYTGINRYFIPLRETFARVYAMRGAALASITIVLILAIFVFDVKVSKIIEHTPLLSSIIDTELLQEFESVNENDEFYQALMTDDESSDDETAATATGSIHATTTGSTTPVTENNSAPVITQTPAPATTGIVTVTKDAVRKENLVAIPPVVQKSLPAGVKILDIKVRSISDNEKIFRISLEDGTLHDVRVMKVGDRFRIVDENIQWPLRRR